MTLPTKDEARELLHEHVVDTYQRLHAEMVATAVAGYAEAFQSAVERGEVVAGLETDIDPQLWWLTGYLHDIDFEKHPDTHPGPSLEWFREWGYPEALVHAVEAHAYGYNGFTVKPETKLAAALMACDEISGIFYAYQKLNPIPYGEMKVSSIKKRIKDKGFAPKINRDDIALGVELLELEMDEHIANLITSFSALDV